MISPVFGGSLLGYIAYILMNLAVALFIVFAYRKNDLGRQPDMVVLFSTLAIWKINREAL